MPSTSLSPLHLALHAVRLLDSKGAEELTLLELAPAERNLCDYVVIGNGRSDRQIATLVSEVYHFCKRHGIAHFPVEGQSGWHVIDCHEVIVHAFEAEVRAFYRLEELWPQARRLDHRALLAELPALPEATTEA